ncbi:hypothetical protein BJL95_15200 [Methylomonas sp. LWB]|uniref:hypothetical protein n=1 Tax=Methylomonas sp. LWB TaxID=1905845 RepID=UPI0008D9DE6D|nr:hypothetical protein [Methylomonas sp. LWB]OHX35576.1 hypothetical protein BJL95_15200 [Methylomonas sp. LWB]
MTVSFVESDMTFGPYPDGRCFLLEQSDIYKNIKNNGIKTVEALLISNDSKKIFFIEAKSTVPQPQAKYHKLNPGIENIELLLDQLNQDQAHIQILKKARKELGSFKNESWYIEIKEKFLYSLNLLFSIYLNRHANELPDAFNKIETDKLEIRLIIVIKSCKADHLKHINSHLATILKPVAQAWNLGPSAFHAINEEMARSRNIVA